MCALTSFLHNSLSDDTHRHLNCRVPTVSMKAVAMDAAAAAGVAFALVALNSVDAFTPVSTARRSRVLGHQQAQTASSTCALSRSDVAQQRPSGWALFGTGPSYTDQIAELTGEGGEGEDGEEVGGTKKRKKKAASEEKQKVKLEAEVTFFEGGPDPSEMVAPTVSILTVIGIVPFTASVARQAWVKYTLTSRRIKIVSGWLGRDTTEVVYPDIVNMVYVWRFFGRCGDMVLTLRDGSKLEVRSLPDFERNYNYIFERTSARCQAESQIMKAPQ